MTDDVCTRATYLKCCRALPDSVLSFDPLQSSGVFIGVGGYDNSNSNGPANLGEPPAKDAVEMQSIATDTCGLPEDATQVLISSGTSENDATRLETIKQQIKRVSKRASSGGIFFLHISGHGGRISELTIRTSDNDEKWPYDGVLLPSDFIHDKHTFDKFLTCNTIVRALEGCEVKAVLVTVDACHSASFARDLCRVASNVGPPMVVFAACSEAERSTTWPQIERGLFTYTVADFLKKNARPGYLPVRPLQDHLDRVFYHLNFVHREGHVKDVTEMNPVTKLSFSEPHVLATDDFSGFEPAEAAQEELIDIADENTALEQERFEFVENSLRNAGAAGTVTPTDFNRIIKCAKEWAKTNRKHCFLDETAVLGPLLRNQKLRLSCFGYATYSLAMHLVHRLGIPTAQLAQKRVVFELWVCFAAELPMLFETSNFKQIRDAYVFFFYFHRRLFKHHIEKNLATDSLKGLEDLQEHCEEAYKKPRDRYNQRRASDTS